MMNANEFAVPREWKLLNDHNTDCGPSLAEVSRVGYKKTKPISKYILMLKKYLQH